jgi:hypothetical protein
MTTSTDPSVPDTADWSRPLLARQIAMLGELAEAGLEVALLIRDDARAASSAPDPQPSQAEETGAPPHLFMAYSRVARAVRLTLILQADLIKALREYDRLAAHRAEAALREDARLRDQRTIETRDHVERIVGRLVDCEVHDPDEIARMVRETAERLDQDEGLGDLLSRPLSELVALICRDLGLSPDWPRLAEEAWARRELATAEVGWPLASISKTRPNDGRLPTARPRPSPGNQPTADP